MTEGNKKKRRENNKYKYKYINKKESIFQMNKFKLEKNLFDSQRKGAKGLI